MDISIWGDLFRDADKEGSVEGVISKCREAGIAQYLAYVYPLEESRFGPSIDSFAYHTSYFAEKFTDIFGPLLRAGKKQGVRVQPWVLPFCVHLMKGETRQELNRRGYQIRSDEDVKLHENEKALGEQGLLPCPTWKENRDRGVCMVRDYIENHATDLIGLHLDFIRYRNSDFSLKNPCHCEACKKEYKQILGKDFVTSEEMSNPGILFKMLEMRHRYIREMLEEIRDITNKAGLMLTSAVRTNVFTDAMCEGQDWPAWIRDGLIDEVYCMNYVVDRAWHLDLVRLNQSVVPESPKIKVAHGIGKNSSCGKATPDQIVGAIRDVEAEGGNAVSIFCYSGMEDADFEALKQFK